jgi:hypothetical protein
MWASSSLTSVKVAIDSTAAQSSAIASMLIRAGAVTGEVFCARRSADKVGVYVETT